MRYVCNLFIRAPFGLVHFGTTIGAHIANVVGAARSMADDDGYDRVVEEYAPGNKQMFARHTLKRRSRYSVDGYTVEYPN